MIILLSTLDPSSTVFCSRKGAKHAYASHMSTKLKQLVFQCTPRLFHYMDGTCFVFSQSKACLSSQAFHKYTQHLRVLVTRHADVLFGRTNSKIPFRGILLFVRPPGLEPGMTVPKTGVISISLRAQMCALYRKNKKNAIVLLHG